MHMIDFNDRRPTYKVTTKEIAGHPGKARSVMIDGQHHAHMWPYGGEGEWATDLDRTTSYASAQEAKDAILKSYKTTPASVRAYRAGQQLAGVTPRKKK